VRTSLGRKALADAPPRPNTLPIQLPALVLVLWLGAVSLALWVAQQRLAEQPQWHQAVASNAIFLIAGTAAIVAIIRIAKVHFVGGLRGFGLDGRTLAGHSQHAMACLVAIWPVVMAAILLVTWVGKILHGQDFELEPHEELKVISSNPQISLRILVIVVAVLVAPVLEEMLFRGLLQSAIRSYLERWCEQPASGQDTAGPTTQQDPPPAREPVKKRPQRVWLSVIASSALFAVVHPNLGHWPALFALSMCLGYAYEKSGSLLQPIAIHSVFNAVMVAGVLVGGQ